jgi:hypothetical protein
MLLSDFLTRVVTYASVDGAPFLDTTAERQVFIGEKLQDFTVQCPCIYFDDITLTLTANTRLYRFDDYTSTLTRSGMTQMALSEPTCVWVNGTALRNFQGHPGPVGSKEIEDWFPQSINDTGSEPRFWGIHAPGTIFLYPTPTTTPTVRLAGWAQHPQITTSTVISTTAVSLPTSHLNTAIKFCAAHLMDPLATGDGKSRASQILGEALAEMQEMQAKYVRYRSTRGPRGGVRLDVVQLDT